MAQGAFRADPRLCEGGIHTDRYSGRREGNGGRWTHGYCQYRCRKCAHRTKYGFHDMDPDFEQRAVSGGKPAGRLGGNWAGWYDSLYFQWLCGCQIRVKRGDQIYTCRGGSREAAADEAVRRQFRQFEA